MPLTNQQKIDLENSINGYAFPPIYYDFVTGAQIDAGNIIDLESVIRTSLLSPQLQQVQHGLANVVYWGNANAGYQMFRVNQFMNRVTNHQIQQFQALVAGGNIPTLKQVRRLKMPQFSGISFLSKIIAFIDPTNYCVLDLLLARLRNVAGHKALHGLTVTTQVRVTTNNSAAYYAWCQECRAISNRYYDNRYRVVDIERGFFNFIQSGQLVYAQQLYNDA